MKLKKILLEDLLEERLSNLNDLLNSKYYNTSEILLYRGSDKPIPTSKLFWEERSIRKDREPRDTPKFIHYLVIAVGEKFFPDIPRRNESKFAMAGERMKKRVDEFGDFTYVVFPEQTADIGSLNDDPTPGYFGYIPNYVHYLIDRVKSGDLNMERIEEEYENSFEFIKYLYRWEEDSELNYDDYTNFLVRNIDDILDEVEEMDEDPNFNSQYITWYKKIFDNVFNYFEYMEDGIMRGAKEVLFDGENYLVVKVSEFEKYFEYRDGRWTLKREYQ